MIQINLSQRDIIVLLAIIMIICAAPVIAQYCIQDLSALPEGSQLPYSLAGYCKQTLIADGETTVGCSGSFPATCSPCGCTSGYTLVRTGSHFVPNSPTTQLSAKFFSCMKNP
ncbi:MAG TPA: hypothetical protein P5246_05065 [Candidatus Omnitrophota bacterium]|nr:hypothetical protein [Candidatus Omnitrophota bacterium]